MHVSECPFISASTSHRLVARLTQSLMCNLVPERCAMMGHSVCQRQIIRWRLLFFASRQWWPFRLRPHIALTAGKYYSIAEVPSCARDRTMFGRSLCQGLVCAYVLPHVSECSFSFPPAHRIDCWQLLFLCQRMCDVRSLFVSLPKTTLARISNSHRV